MYYSIILTDGKIINIKATGVEWCKDQMARFINDHRLVAKINMKNVVGWVETEYKV